MLPCQPRTTEKTTLLSGPASATRARLFSDNEFQEPVLLLSLLLYFGKFFAGRVPRRFTSNLFHRVAPNPQSPREAPFYFASSNTAFTSPLRIARRRAAWSFSFWSA
jgi:hypothetical protein